MDLPLNHPDVVAGKTGKIKIKVENFLFLCYIVGNRVVHYSRKEEVNRR